MLMLYEPNETVWWTPFFIWIPEVFGSAPAACVALRQYATNLYACAVRLRLKLPSRRDRSSPQLCTISACSQTLLFQQKIYEIWVSVTVENREGMNPFSNESSCHINGVSAHHSPRRVFPSLELCNPNKKNKYLQSWVTLRKCFTYPLMRLWYQLASAWSWCSCIWQLSPPNFTFLHIT